MARPKSEKPTKTVIKSIRLTPDDHKRLLERFKTLQQAIEWLVNQTSQNPK
jgi:hypothetical protein